MPYSSFTIAEVKQRLGIIFEETQELFSKVPAAAVSDSLAAILADSTPLALLVHTEKARSEWIVSPILLEVRRRMGRRVSLFSGSDFNVDPAAGLTGACDFLFSLSPEQLVITAPVAVVVEAKNDSIKDGIGQCAAQMVAAQRLNASVNNGIETIYGCVTTGSLWRFLRLHGTTIFLDSREHFLSELDRILGIFLNILSPQPAAFVAA